MTTRAAALTATNHSIELLDLELQSPRKGEVLVRMLAAGICHSDWHVVTGATRHPLPVVLGHEGAGQVIDVGEGVSGIAIGDLVILNWAPSCGKCFYCQKGKPNLCSAFLGPVWAGAQLDGTTRLKYRGQDVTQFCALGCFSEFAVVPESSCVVAPAELPAEIAALIGCAVSTGIGSVVNTAQLEAGSVAVVLGAGGVGLSTVLGAKLAGAAEVLVLDPLTSRRDAALEVGASAACDRFEDLLDSVRERTESRGADYVFEASGAQTAQEGSLALARPGGTIVLTGLSPMGSATNLPGAVLVREEKTVKGSYYGSTHPKTDFLSIAHNYLNGKLPLDRLISDIYSLEQINEGFGDMLCGSSRRGVVKF